MQLDKYDVDRRAEFLLLRQELLLELDGGLSANGIRHRKRLHRRRSIGWIAARRSANTLRRLADIVIAGLLLILLLPVTLIVLPLAKISGGGLRKQERLGRWATHFSLYQLYFPETSRLRGFAFLQQWPALYNVFKGDMSFIGPRPIAPSEEFAEKRLAWKRYNLRPGLLSLWWIRKRANIAHSSEVTLDLEYEETRNFWGDVGIAARAIPAALYSSETTNAPAHIKFLGVRIDNLTMAEASAQIVHLAQGNEPTQICFVNADCVNLACSDQSYQATLTNAKLVLADGIGIRLAGTILDQNVRENVNGTDMLPYLCAAVEESGLGIYLLGGTPGVADDAAKWITEHYPTLRVAGCHHGFVSPEEEPALIEEINSSGAHIVLVAMGSPRQDKWIADHMGQVTAKVMIGVGGLFDFYSGRIPRAPVWVRELGMEWFYRFYREPRRMWRRYFLGNFDFLYRVIRERVRLRSAHGVEGQGR
jgi:N-acetylglucosaminyldiphosphoundecaprenol N-acetyl-beta-D-mannosaminyltransferase